MGKSGNFIGQPLFNQLIKLISRQKIQEIAQKGGYNRYVKRFDGYSHLVTLLFAVFSRYDSLREIVLGLMSEANKLSHLGLLQLVSRSTLSDANNRRSHVFFEKIYTSLYERYRFCPQDNGIKQYILPVQYYQSYFPINLIDVY